jgi:hypothetical protein
MRFARIIRLVLGLSLISVIGLGCGDSTTTSSPDPAAAPPTAPVRPGLKPKAAEKMKSVMPHL